MVFRCIAPHIEDALVDAAGVPIVIDGQFGQVVVEFTCHADLLHVSPYIEGVCHCLVGGEILHVVVADDSADGSACCQLEGTDILEVGVADGIVGGTSADAYDDFGILVYCDILSSEVDVARCGSC